MDGSLVKRQEVLLQRLKARTDKNGNPKANYRENVAAIRAELANIEERINACKS